MADEKPQDGSSISQVPLPIHLTPQLSDPTYANAAQIQHSPYEFMLTFLRAEYMLQGSGPEGKTPLMIAARVALSHQSMKEFLDAAIDNYESYLNENPLAPRLKIMGTETDG
jgi:hypothetical protein